MAKSKKTKLGFTTILHDPRLRFDLTNNDYCIADCIYHLSHNTSGDVIGWCYAKRETIGTFFGLSRQSVHTIIKKLEMKGLIEVHQETKYLRSTQVWYENFVIFELKKCKL